MIQFAAGFALATALAIAWHFGFIQPRMKALKDLVEAKIMGGSKPPAAGA